MSKRTKAVISALTEPGHFPPEHGPQPVRSLSAALGVAFFASVYSRREIIYSAAYAEKVTTASPSLSVFIARLNGLLPAHSPAGSQYARSIALSVLRLDISRYATTQAVDYTMIVSALIILLLFPSVYFLRWPKTVGPVAESAGGRPPSAG